MKNILTIKQFHKLENSKSKIEYLLYFANRSPSTHNSQPWKARTTGNKLYVFKDSSKHLPFGDKTNRNMYISIGCFIENFIIAAEYYKFIVDLNLNSTRKANLVATIDLRNMKKTSTDKTNTQLFRVIEKRTTVRGVYKKRKVPTRIVRDIKSHSIGQTRIKVLDKKSQIDFMAKMTAKGMIKAYKNRYFRVEMSKWINNVFSRKSEGIPSYSLRMPALISLIFPLTMRYVNTGKLMAKLNSISISSAPLGLILSSPDDSVENWINVGRTAQRIMLYITSRKLKYSIYVASLEIGDIFQDVVHKLKLFGVPQFFIVAGYMNYSHKVTPRNQVKEILLK